MSQSQTTFLIRQTLSAVLLNGIFSALAVLLVFRHKSIVLLSGSPSLIADSILQTFIATFMSTLPPSVLTAKWILTRPDLTIARTPMPRLWIRALVIALAACLASSLVLPFAMPELLASALPFRKLLLLKCLYGMAIGVAATPCAVAAVLRGPRPGEGTEQSLGTRPSP